ncbi:MAG: tRNA preQ1(34) S-adenosylmethionine ribosyltransferase-isomerase QueA [Kiritimatiellae bacterium]|nr:tRNA preQ1(34) S-adenosylmethionine ribosyltransferase-isomerase QueA [Kiritimatiellia bacterium]
MKTSDFEYHLPPELIAQEPAPVREEARMLVVHRDTKTWEHRHVRDLPDLLVSSDLLVVNDTRVIPARVFGRKEGTGGRVELLFLEETAPGEWDALLRCARRPAVGAWVEIGAGKARAQVLAEGETGRVSLRIESARPLLEILEEEGVPPLPPYISRDYAHADPRLAADRGCYQTVYASRPGAVAAPTAGLHFSDALFQTLESRGVHRTAITLHVGLGTFRPVSAPRVEDHRMEQERYEIGEEAAREIEAARAKGRRVIAVGSTVVRTLETVAAGPRREDADHHLPWWRGSSRRVLSAPGTKRKLLAASGAPIVPCIGRSDLFIRPPFKFRVVDAMLTNFHLPRSTLLMMVCAFAGRKFVMQLYEEAVREKYRFYSYGDCMLIV